MLYRKKKNRERVKMAGEDTELCGFMDAKLPGGQRVKKRPLAPWKVWRRHWCAVRKLGPGLGLEILLDYGVSSAANNANGTPGYYATGDKDTSCIRIPANALICRTESRSKQFAFGIFPAKERKPLIYLASVSESESQRWMASLRQLLRPRRHRYMDGTYNVSMVDNAHSRSAGLTGLYGDLVASRTGIFVKDVHTGEIVETFEWTDVKNFHLCSIGRTEDVKRICVLHTTREFRGGVGELHVFCAEAPRLLQDLVSQGRGPRHKHNQPHHHLAQRPLSLSEGDLRIAAQQERELGCTSQGFQALKHKIATNIVNAGLGLLLSARSGSEAKLINDINNGSIEKMTSKQHHARAVDNVYQPEPASMNNVTSSLEELEEPSSLRRVSNISDASGIYEEIRDDFVPAARTRGVPSNLYEDPDELILNSQMKLQPPPLPPRQRYGSGSTRNGSLSDDGLDSEGGTRSATPNTQDDATPTPEDKTSDSHMPMPIDTSDYVPMSPRLQDIVLHELQQQENTYMVMR